MPKLDKLTPERRQQLKEYLDSLKEIHSEISEILSEANLNLKETGGNKSTGLKMTEMGYRRSYAFQPNSFEATERLDGLINQRDLSTFEMAAQNIFDNLTYKEGFDASDVLQFLVEKLRKAAAPYNE